MKKLNFGLAIELLQQFTYLEEELKEVQPIVDEAKRAVGQIKPESLSEIRALRAPPDAVRDILEGVLRLMGTLDTSWTSIKKLASSFLLIFINNK